MRIGFFLIIILSNDFDLVFLHKGTNIEKVEENFIIIRIKKKRSQTSRSLKKKTILFNNRCTSFDYSRD